MKTLFLHKLKAMFRREQKVVKESKKEEPQETDTQVLQRIDAQVKDGFEVPDSFAKNESVVVYYYLQCRVHGFMMSYERAQWFFQTQRHILQLVDAHAQRLSVAGEDKDNDI